MSHIRRISALLTCLVLVLALVCACGGSSELRPYKTALSDSAPSGAVLESSLECELGTLLAKYTAVFSDGAVSVEYERDSLTEYDGGTAGSGEITSSEGSYSRSADGAVTGEISPLVLALLTRALNLSDELIAYPAVSEDGTLTFSVTAENTEAVFGTAIGYNASCKIALDGKNIKTVEVTYTAKSGEAKLVCEYSY